jgi:hypothetical protein
MGWLRYAREFRDEAVPFALSCDDGVAIDQTHYGRCRYTLKQSSSNKGPSRMGTIVPKFDNGNQQLSDPPI